MKKLILLGGLTAVVLVVGYLYGDAVAEAAEAKWELIKNEHRS